MLGDKLTSLTLVYIVSKLMIIINSFLELGFGTPLGLSGDERNLFFSY